MIKKIFANRSSFKTIEFQPGFNVVWADRTKESTKKDSRNGLGKSTLIEIIHFCLGSKVTQGKGLLVNELSGWEFSLLMQIADKEFTITRAVNDPRRITITGDIASWPIPSSNQDGQAYAISDWNTLLGHFLFGLPVNSSHRYQPSFRSLISYFTRRGKDAFSIPFEHHRKQKEWDRQINNAFLLGLAWEDASELQILKDKKKGLEDFRKAAKAGIVKGFIGSLGDLEAQKIRIKTQADHEASDLQSFKVHPQYEQIQTEANKLTEEIHAIVNANTIDRRLLSLYEKSLSEELPPTIDSIDRLYQDAGIALPGIALRRIDDVKKFHETVIKNRSVFLATEISRLKKEIGNRDKLIALKTENRANVMDILQTHGALAEHTLLQKRHMDTINNFNSISTMIDNIKAFDNGLSEIKIAQEVLQQKARRDYDERQSIRERAVALFNTYSEQLYSAPGKLIIDVGPTGFRYDIDIERSGSSGINNMKVFCYDLMLARLWADQKASPHFLLHDSIIFDGVDERQRALALETAAAEATKNGFQYICTLNSDYIPWNEFSKDFDLRKHIRATLTDKSIDGCLLGIRF